jgi:hypothetical protein
MMILAHAGWAQAQTAQHPGSFKNIVDAGKLAAVPTSSTCLVGSASTCGRVTTSIPYVCGYTFSGTGQVITVQDAQPTPVTWLNSTLGASGTGNQVTASASFSDSACFPFIGGVYWSASGTGAFGDVIVKF